MLHMIKLAVGCATIGELTAMLATRQRVSGHTVVTTKSMPKRAGEIAGKGSLYRVLSGFIMCRQPIEGFQRHQKADGSSETCILVSDQIIPVEPRAMKPFQGWRYLDASDAPDDLRADGGPHGQTSLPRDLRRELERLCLL